MFSRLLIANRGEIACRIIKTAQRLGIYCIAVYSEADKQALHVQLADEAYCIGPATAIESYLSSSKIIEAALAAGAQAIHPGYGFLSENAEFAEQCLQAQLIFVGPSPSAIRAMGSKSAAKQIMERAQVPLIPGYHGEQQDLATLQAAAEKLQYPVLLKAAAGGGGKGMRVVHKAAELSDAIAAAKREALASFGDDQLLQEKYFVNPRHVEMQIFADQHGNIVYLFERDCSIQRRHQKIIEEAPAPHFSSKLREAMGNIAINAAKAIQYIGAGTIEFLLVDDAFYFMEMNTRLQVEHAITEMITGVDLVEWQLKIAAGEKLPLTQAQLAINGHAFEARIYAEDPQKDFLPSTGKLQYLKTPATNAHVRLDTGVQQGDSISPYYDPLLMKLIVWDKDRQQALKQLNDALGQIQIVGVANNLELLTNLSEAPAFQAGKVHTGFIQQHPAVLAAKTVDIYLQILATLIILLQQNNTLSIPQHEDADIYSPWLALIHWRLNLTEPQKIEFLYNEQKLISLIIPVADYYQITIDNKTYNVNGCLKNSTQLLAEIDKEKYSANVFGLTTELFILFNNHHYKFKQINANNSTIEHTAKANKTTLTTPLPGKIVSLAVKAGSTVKAGAALASIEAMKMEHTIQAPYDGIVKEWYYNVGDLVQEGVELLVFTEIENEIS